MKSDCSDNNSVYPDNPENPDNPDYSEYRVYSGILPDLYPVAGLHRVFREQHQGL